MKRFSSAIFIFLLISAIMVMADDFKGMWKDVNNSGVKDMPATQIEMLDKIIAKARDEKSYGNLMKAVKERMEKRYMISPDSFNADVDRLEKETEQTDHNTVLYAVYNSILGNIYQEKASMTYGDETGRTRLNKKSKEYFTRSLSNPELLAGTKTGRLYPFFSNKKGNDLLISLSYNAMMFETARDYYVGAGNRPCALIMSLECLRQNNRQDKVYLQSLNSLIAEYGDIEECCEVAIAKYNYLNEMTKTCNEELIKFVRESLNRWGSWKRASELKNAELRLTRPSFEVVLSKSQIAENEKLTVSLNNVRNVADITTRVWKTRLTTKDIINEDAYGRIDEDFYKSAIKPLSNNDVKSYTETFDAKDYELSDKKFEIGNLDKGIYVFETTCNIRGIRPVYNIVYVSNLFVISESLPENKVRIAVLDSRSGQPINNAAINILCRNENRRLSINEEGCNADGELLYDGKNNPFTAFAYTEDDRYMSATRISRNFSFRDNNRENSQTAIFTDRAVYRPGQTVKVAVVSYKRLHDKDMKVEAGRTINISIKDANNKVVSKKELKTDEYGKASTEFVLPSKTLNGKFRISDDNWNYTTIRVEEYKRPTFRVEFTSPSDKYSMGDTVKVRALATSFAGVPVQGASVKYTVKRLWMPWLRFYSGNNGDVLSEGKTVTSGEGSFAVDVPLTDIANRDRGFYYFIVEAYVTDAAGETRSGRISIPVSEKDIWFNCDLPEKIEKSTPVSVKFDLKNTAHKVLDADVTFCIDGRKEVKVKANEDFDINRYTSDLASGRHKLKACVMGEEIEKEFVLFSLKDKTPAADTDEWFYITSDTFSEDGSSLFMQLGSSNKVHVLYSVISGRKIIKTGTEEINNEIKTYELKYKEEYGEGILVNYAWVKDGKLYTGNVKIKKPLPDKKLDIKWITFRDRLTPGQKEQWTLEIKRKDKSKADASVIATLYDMSLDNIIPHRWDNIPGMPRRLPFTNWIGTAASNIQRDYVQADIKWFDNISSLFEKFPQIDLYSNIRMRGYDGAMTALPQMSMTRKGIAYGEMESNDIKMKESASNDDLTEEQVTDNAPQLRENLSETAFFYPSMTTDSNGKVNISFTLPESMTTWKFMAFANDKEMRNEVMSDEIIAQKKVMVQPNMPRFVRRGDKASISARISNLSGKEIRGNAIMQICDAETDEIITQKQSAFNIKKDGTTSVSFDYDADDNSGDIVVCRIFAEGKGYSDGEQHYVSILSDKEMIINTGVLTNFEMGSLDVNTKGLFRSNATDCRFTLEYTDNPAWFAIKALPSINENNNDDAITLATKIYANTLAGYIANASPCIKRVVKLWNEEKTPLTSRLQVNAELKDMLLEETPWVAEAETETENKQRITELFDENTILDRTSSAVKKLREAQLGDGSFGWWRGMDGNVYITTAVVEMLTRLEVMTGRNEQIRAILSGAMQYLSDKTAEQVRNAKDIKEFHLTSTNLKYLYIKSMRGEMFTEADRWLMNQLDKQKPADMSIYDKCMAAIIYDKTGNKKKALQLINSVKEYTVYSKGMGRYFDAPSAGYSWYDYRIPTEVMAIEALQTVIPSDKETIAQMQQWLIQEKRTTSWNTPINSVNAIYALTNGGEQITSTSEKSVITLNGRKIEGSEAGTGYVKVSEKGSNINLNIYKKHEGMSWLSLYGTYTAELKDIDVASTGLRIQREIITEDKKEIKVGDRLKVRITISADRDYDFVQVTDKRAACMEPANQISGYNGRYYYSMKNNAAYYYFDMMPKGTHVIETEYYVDRIGSYTTGTCRVQCAYAPEFNGRTEAEVIIVK